MNQEFVDYVGHTTMRLSSSWTDAGKRTEAIKYLIKGL